MLPIQRHRDDLAAEHAAKIGRDARRIRGVQADGQHPMALQLRFLQTLTEVASENNSTTIFPLPIDLITPFLKAPKQS